MKYYNHNGCAHAPLTVHKKDLQKIHWHFPCVANKALNLSLVPRVHLVRWCLCWLDPRVFLIYIFSYYSYDYSTWNPYMTFLCFRFLYGDQARFFGDEIQLDLKHSKTGTVAMASAGENLNASQVLLLFMDIMISKDFQAFISNLCCFPLKSYFSSSRYPKKLFCSCSFIFILAYWYSKSHVIHSFLLLFIYFFSSTLPCVMISTILMGSIR